MEPTVLSEFKSMLPPLSDEEYAALEKSIVEEGCLEPIVVCNTPVVVDGHQRLEICKRHGIPYEVVEMSFDTEVDVALYILRAHASRRGLSDLQHIDLAREMEQRLRERMRYTIDECLM